VEVLSVLSEINLKKN